jgi:hypothetical protein
MLRQVPSGLGTAMRNKVVEHTVRLLRDMGEMPTRRLVEEPAIKVGLSAKVERVVQLLKVKDNNHMVLLHGMGGIGKTTLARAVFNRLHSNNPTLPCCFLKLDPDDAKVGKIAWKQQQLLKELAYAEGASLYDEQHGRDLLAEKLQGKRVLLVVDNLWGNCLDILLPEGFVQLLGKGSMVLATSREKEAVMGVVCEEDVSTAEMECLSSDQSMELFCKYAFSGLAPVPSSWVEHIERSRWASQIMAVLHMCGGLPMALEVLGRYFSACDNKAEFERSVQTACSDQVAGWKETERTLFGALSLSWSTLKGAEQEALLDIALMLNGQPWDWVEHYCGCNTLGRLYILGLVKKQVAEQIFNGNNMVAMLHDTVAFFCCDAAASDTANSRPSQHGVVKASGALRQVCGTFYYAG